MPSVLSSMIMHKHGVNSTGGMPAIPEDQDVNTPPPPPVPPRALHRPSVSRATLTGSPPPAYELKQKLYPEDPDNPVDEKLLALRNHRQLAKRGGWRRLAFIALMVVLLIVALAVGLGVGLNQRRNLDSSLGRGSVNPPINTTFPAGRYAIETVLDTQSTNCTSNPATWRCYPYSTYAESNSVSSSAATFTWMVNYLAKNNSFTISSAENIFSIIFNNETLWLQDAGLATEHYSFQITMQKPVRPIVALSSSNAAATCFFNDTIFRGYLYTKMPSSLPLNTSDTEPEKAYTPWPYAVRVEQVTTSGSGTPTCLDTKGISLGDFSADEGRECNCLYRNTGT